MKLPTIIVNVGEEKTIPTSLHAYNHGIAQALLGFVRNTDMTGLKGFTGQLTPETGALCIAFSDHTGLAENVITAPLTAYNKWMAQSLEGYAANENWSGLKTFAAELEAGTPAECRTFLDAVIPAGRTGHAGARA